jgi:DHA1 family tetracycline resistance protein-like MFS transporter
VSAAPAAAAPPRRAAFIFIFFTVLLDMLALGVVIPVLPKLVESFVAGNTARASEIYGLFGTAWALMQFLFAPVQGALSDRYGRRPVILASNFALGLDYVLMALAPNLLWLFAGRILSGVCAASISTAYAYVADVTAPEKRATSFGMLGAAFGIGFVVGPAVGGLLGTIDPRLPFWVAAILSLLNGLYGILVLPESLPHNRRAAIAWRGANPFGALQLLRSEPRLAGLAAANFLSYLAHAVLQTTFVLYAGYRYGWDEKDVGLALAVVGVCSIIVQAGLVGRAVSWLGERGALVAGFLSGAAAFAVYGLAPSGSVFTLGIPIMALWGIASPAAQSLMSRCVAATEQGRLQGANSSIQGIANLLGPSLFAFTFAHAIRAEGAWNIPGAPFLLAAALVTASAWVSWRATVRA